MKGSQQKSKNRFLKSENNIKHKRDSENRIIIDMNITDDTNFLSVFSAGEAPIIDCTVANFLESRTKSILPNEQLVLHIHGSCVDENEKIIYTNAIKEYYLQQYFSYRRDLKKNYLTSSLLAIFGIAILMLAIFLADIQQNPVWSSAVDIVAWVLIWEAVHILVFKNKELQFNKLRSKAFASMDVEYYP